MQYQLATQTDVVHDTTQNAIFPLGKYSRLITILRITAWINRFLFNTRNKDKRQGPLTAEEIDTAETYWKKKVTQQKGFLQEIKELQSGMEVHNQSKIKNLNPFLDEKGIMRVGGRLQKSNLNYREKHPCILPTNDRFTKLQVNRSHEVLHCSLQWTLTQIWEQFSKR